MSGEIIVARENTVNPINAVTASKKKEISLRNLSSQQEYETKDIFFNEPKPSMQHKLHTLMYSGGTKDYKEDVSLDINSLVPTQRKLFTSFMERYVKPRQFEDYPIVASYKGKNYVIDGHHRIAADILKGKSKIKVIQYVMT